MPMSLMRLRYDHRQHGRRGHLYGTNGTWKNYPTWCALLDVGFMIILRRTGWFILIWAFGAGSRNLTTVIFQISQLSSKTWTKLQRSLAFAMHIVLETVPVKLYDRSHPAHKACKDGLPYGSRTLWVSRDKKVQGSLTRAWFQRSQCQRFWKVSKS